MTDIKSIRFSNYRSSGFFRLVLILLTAAVLISALSGICRADADEPVENKTASEGEKSDPAKEEDEAGKITYGCEMDFNSRYVWRGIPFSRGAVMQPYLWVSSNNFTYSLWANMPIARGAGRGKFDEIDPRISYEAKIGKFEVEPAVQLYLYPDGADNTGEAAVTVSYPMGDFKLSTFHGFDIRKYRGAYYGEAGIALEKELNPNLSIKAYTGAGWGTSKFIEAYSGIPAKGLYVINNSVSATFYPKAGGPLYVRPHYEFSTITSGKLRKSLESPDLSSWGVVIGTEF